MSRRYRVGIVGSGHMHVNNVAALFKHPQVDMAACADTPPERPEPRVAPYTGEWSRRNIIASLRGAMEIPKFLMGSTRGQIREKIREIFEAARGNLHRLVLAMADVEYGTPDEKIAEMVECCRSGFSSSS